MRRALSVFVALLAGCAQISGLDSLGVCDGAACADATADARQDAPFDGGAEAQVKDADASLDASDASTADVVVVSTCASPSDCNAPGDVCCANVVLSGNSTQCTLKSEAVSCKAASSCTTSVTLQCGNEIVRLCKSNADCTENFYTRCCTFKFGDASVESCTNAIIADAGGATCL